MAEPLLIDLRALAKLVPVHTKTLRRWADSNQMPASIKVGGRRLWHADQIHAWIAWDCPKRDQFNARWRAQSLRTARA
jgi:excisionase family DNA binding protein